MRAVAIKDEQAVSSSSFLLRLAIEHLFEPRKADIIARLAIWRCAEED
jgi:hypothetical protein